MKIADVTDWDLVRTFLAVHRAGSTLGASALLGLSQPTVARRIQALERDLDLPLFYRRNKGYLPTADGEALLPAAIALEDAAGRFAQAATARRRHLRGTVRLTCGEMLANHHLGPILGEFARCHPNVAVELMVSDRPLDIAAGEADVAIRGVEPSRGVGVGEGLVGRRLFDLPWAVYAARAYVDAHGRPGSPSDLACHRIITAEGGLARLEIGCWLERNAPDAQVVGRANTLPALIAQVRAGRGLGVVSRGFLDNDPTLVRCFDLPSDHDGQVWLVTSEDARRKPHVRALLDFLSAFIAARQSRLLRPRDPNDGTAPSIVVPDDDGPALAK